MGDLVQLVEHGFQDPDEDQPHWTRGHRYPVPASNRRRLLDSGRLHPADDGWAYEHTPLPGGGHAVCRIRWDDARLWAPEHREHAWGRR